MQIQFFGLSTQFPAFFTHASRVFKSSSIFLKTAVISITETFRPLASRATLHPYLTGTALAVASLTVVYFCIQARNNEATLKNIKALEEEIQTLQKSKLELTATIARLKLEQEKSNRAYNSLLNFNQSDPAKENDPTKLAAAKELKAYNGLLTPDSSKPPQASYKLLRSWSADF